MVNVPGLSTRHSSTYRPNSHSTMKTKMLHRILQPTPRGTLLRSSTSLSIVLLVSPVRLRPFSSTIPDIGCPRSLHCSLADICNVKGSKTIELRFRFDTIQLTLPPPPPWGVRKPHGWRRQLVSDEVARESDVQLRFSGVSSLRGVAGEKMRAEAANG